MFFFMNLACSNCNTILLPENINISTDLGKCANCHAILKLSELSVFPVTPEVTSTPPEGSNIVMENLGDGALIISIPKKGIKVNHLPTLVFALTWLTAISFFTFFSFGSDLFSILFSIPFWAVGIFMLLGVFRGSQESQKITITKNTIKVEHLRPINSSSVEIKISEIHEVSLANITNSFNSLGQQLINSFSGGHVKSSEYGVPTILSYADNITFFESAKKEDQEWVTAFLKNLTIKMNG